MSARGISKNFPNRYLNWFTKTLCAGTLFLIFAGGQVKSHEAGLSVPDWPLSYGMLFPPMVGGVFYEHGHRLIAAGVGFLMLGLAVSLLYCETRRWIKFLGLWALGAVILQGLLGGLTVKFFLPPAVSISHAVLAQTFLILTVILAYGESQERREREESSHDSVSGRVLLLFLTLTGFVFLQLILGAVMRHTSSGLAIPDFPTMGGRWLPGFDHSMQAWINDWRFMNNLEPVAMQQIVIHFLHRFLAAVIAGIVLWTNMEAFVRKTVPSHLISTILVLDLVVGIQMALGIFTVLTLKMPLITSLHVVTGAGTLAVCVLLVLKASPLTLPHFQKILWAQPTS